MCKFFLCSHKRGRKQDKNSIITRTRVKTHILQKKRGKTSFVLQKIHCRERGQQPVFYLKNMEECI